MDDNKADKDVGTLSTVEKSRRGREAGSPKVGGRKAGTPNRKTLWLREELDSVGLSWGAEFKKALDENNYKRAEILTSLLPYLNPKLKDKEVQDEIIEEKEISDVLTIIGEN